MSILAEDNITITSQKQTNDLAKSANTNASEAKAIADDTAQYFWYSAEGTDTGAHITEIPQDDFIADPANGGGNLLARSNGIAVRDGLDEEAIFGNGVAQIGRSGQSRAYIDYHSMKLIDKDGTEYFEVADLRDATGHAKITINILSTGADTYEMAFGPLQIVSVFVHGTRETHYTYDGMYEITFDAGHIPTAGVIISITAWNLNADADWMKHYTLGTRSTDQYESSAGVMSVALGYGVIASGQASIAEGWGSEAYGIASHAEGWNTNAYGHSAHAEGIETVANGDYSHAEGVYTVADGEAQTVIGKHNIADSSSAFIIGNGDDSANPSNAFTVDWNGNVVVAGDVTNGTGQKLSDLGASMFEVSSVTTENISLSANTAYSGTITATKAGYYPIAIVGWATNYVTGQVTARSMHTLYLSSQAVGSATITYGIRNNYSASNNGSHTFYILWAKA